jgi:hypothetical protein
MQASLPMYNLPEMQAQNAAFWQAIRTEAERLGVMGLPSALDFARKPVPARIEPDTVFTQVCGWPLQTIYAGQAKVLGVPAYGVAHCAGPTHTAFLWCGGTRPSAPSPTFAAAISFSTVFIRIRA